MNNRLLERFERAIRQRNPALADALQPGLPEGRIREMLEAAKVKGFVEPVVSVFAWKNGNALDESVTLREASSFPGSIYIFTNLQEMIEHFEGFHDGFVYHPKYEEADGRYFPLFWDNSTGYLVEYWGRFYALCIPTMASWMRRGGRRAVAVRCHAVARSIHLSMNARFRVRARQNQSNAPAA